jgi:hypothetical protein
MWTKEFPSELGRLVVRGLMRWLEMMGENPPLTREQGFLTWQVLHAHHDDGARNDQGARPGAPATLRESSIGRWGAQQRAAGLSLAAHRTAH